MKLLETSVLVFFALWLLTALWAGLSGKGKLLRLRKFLWFNGWFSRWSMFLPDKRGRIERFVVSYRDRAKDGTTGDWQLVELEKAWKPTLFLINPDIRLYGFMLNALRSFSNLYDAGKSVGESYYYEFFQNILLGYDRGQAAEQRQIKVERSLDKEAEVILVQSEFLGLS